MGCFVAGASAFVAESSCTRVSSAGAGAPAPARSHLLTSSRTRSMPRATSVCVAPSTTMRSSSSFEISHPVSFFMPITHVPFGPIKRPICPHACTAHRFGPSHSGSLERAAVARSAATGSRRRRFGVSSARRSFPRARAGGGGALARSRSPM
jgi:hypothetical protein